MIEANIISVASYYLSSSSHLFQTVRLNAGTYLWGSGGGENTGTIEIYGF
jgi:hypothetical protein